MGTTVGWFKSVRSGVAHGNDVRWLGSTTSAPKVTAPVTPQVWHHGLVARWWAEFNTGGPEVEYFGGYIHRLGGPALDVACGAGRLLIPFRKAGLDVDGCDISADMLAHCQRRAEAEGVSVNLHQQAAHELDLPRRYRTIVMCGGFGLGGVRAHDQEALVRIQRHLEPGGTLILDCDVAYKSERAWHYWTASGQQELPLPWPDSGDRKVAADGDEIELLGRVVSLDPLDQVITRELRARLWRDGHLVVEEEHVLLERYYFRNELVDMLRVAGFESVTVREGYSDEEPAPTTGILVYQAVR